MSFGSPGWLLALLAVGALILAQRLARRRRRRYAIRFPATDAVVAALSASSRWRSRLPGWLLLSAVAALAVSLARPRLPHRVPVQQAALMLVCDHSGSMAASDVQPTRLGAAVHAADAFIASLPSTVRVGAVAFGSSPDAVQAPQLDHRQAQAVIDSQSATGATDTGDALALSLQLLHGADARHPPAAIVLLSDGAANTGANALSVAGQAASERIPIYTVALGTPDGILPSPDPLQPSIPVPPDPQLMQQIAALSGGRSFNAQSSDQLNSIYSRLASHLGTVTRQRDVTIPVVILAGVLILAALAAAIRVSPRIP